MLLDSKKVAGWPHHGCMFSTWWTLKLKKILLRDGCQLPLTGPFTHWCGHFCPAVAMLEERRVNILSRRGKHFQ